MSRASRALTTPELAIRTPEHVAVRFSVADLGSRAVAVVLDLGLQILGLIFLIWLMVRLFSFFGDLVAGITLIGFFVLRNFYFTFFEVAWHGRTPGKRALGLRVVARDGGPLTADLVFARNLTRELETFLPLSALMAQGGLLAGAPAWVNLATVGWILVLTLLPLFNRQRARLGDLLAGTVVVYEPVPKLLDDLVEENRIAAADSEYTFTARELDIYGIRELQVLEELLRRPPSAEREELLAKVALKVLRKIGRDPGQRVQPERFLRGFYTAQRARLEKKMLLGQRRERKVH